MGAGKGKRVRPLSFACAQQRSPKGKCSTVPAMTERARTLTQYRYP